MSDDPKIPTQQCQCDLCNEYRYVKKIIADRDVDKLSKKVMDLLNAAATTETDLEYYRAVVHGDWPDAKETLVRSLHRIDMKEQNP